MPRRLVREFAVFLGVLCTLVSVQPAYAADAGVRVQYRAADLAHIVREIARATGTRFVFGDELQGRVTITTPDPLTPEEALEVLNAALYMRGFIALPSVAGFRKIVPIAEAASGAPRVMRGPRRGVEGQVTTLVHLKTSDATAVVATLKAMVPKSGRAQAYSPTNSVILVGTETNLARLIELIRLLDHAAAKDVMVRAIRYRSAASIAQSIEQISEERLPASRRARVLVDERSNRVLVKASGERLEAIRRLIERLDQPVEGAGGLHVLRVRNRDPEEVAEIIRGLNAGTAATRRNASASRRIAQLGGELTGRELGLTVDGPTRSLLIRSDLETFRLVAQVVSMLDVLPPRVSVELFALEIRRPSSLHLGVDFFLPITNPKQPGDLAVAIQSTPSGALPNAPSAGTRLFSRFTRVPLILSYLDSAGNTVTLEIPREDVAFQADERQIEAHVLLRPHLVATSGEEHEIFAGDNIPVPVQQSSAPPSAAVAPAAEEGDQPPTPTGGPFLSTRQTIERQDVGIRMRLTPTVHEDERVQLDLSIEISSVGESIAGDTANVGPTIQTRKLDVDVNVAAGEYVVIGTGTDRRQRYSRTGVPLLMDIPILGQLFRRVESSWQDTDLIVVVSARILRSPGDDIAESIRRRLAFERDLVRMRDLTRLPDAPWAILLESLSSESEAREIADAFTQDGLETSVAEWRAEGEDHWDVYLRGYAEFADAAEVMGGLRKAGWSPEIVVLPSDEENDEGRSK